MKHFCGKPLLLLAALFAGLSTAHAQSYPAHSVRILVPFSAGTVLDTLARVVAEQFSHDLKQPVVIVNRPGAAGMLAFGELTSSPPDGYTLIFAGQTQLTIQPHLKSELPYRVEDVAPICQMFETPFALVVGSQSPYKTFADYAAAARAKPATITFGHSGAGSVPHLFGEILAQAAGIKLAGVPYRQLGEQINDVASGAVDSAIFSIGSFSGAAARAIVVFNSRRSKAFPDVPTAAELGYRIPLKSTNGLFAHSGTPPEVLDKLRAACSQAFNSEPFRDMAARLDVNAEMVAGDTLARQLDAERREMKSVIDSVGIEKQ